MAHFYATDSLKKDLARPIRTVLDRINRDDGLHDLPHGDAHQVARAIERFYGDSSHRADRKHTWGQVFRAIFNRHGVYCVSGNCRLALEQTVQSMLDEDRTRLARQRMLAWAAA